MRCPKCQNELSRMQYENVPVEFCKSCKGVWFNSDELNQVVNDLATRPETENAAIELEKAIVGEYDIEEATCSCPQCGETMKQFNFAYDSNIILDKCDVCNGIWTDHNEIMRLAVFRKGNPVLDRMGKAIVKDTGKNLNDRLVDSTSMPASPAAAGLCNIILPVGDDQERNSFPFVVVCIIVVNVLIFAFQSICYQGAEVQNFYCQFGFIPSNAFASASGSYSFLTSMFIHGGLWHLIGNMLFLWIFADNIEDRFGHFKFFMIYLICGLSGAFLRLALNPHSTIPCIGASGAISGMMGAYLILYPGAKIKTIVYGAIMDIPAFAYLIGWFGFQLFFAYLEKDRTGGGIGWLAHIGGFSAGIIIGIIARFATKAKEKSIYPRREKTPVKYDPKTLA